MRIILSTLITAALLDANVYAGERWYVDATVDGKAGRYTDSILRDDFYSASVGLNIDYLDYYSFAFAYNNLKINYKDTGAGGFSINQDAFAGRYQYNFFNDALAGKITAQLVAHRIVNSSQAAQTGTPTGTLAGNATIIAPKLAYMHYDKDLSMDIEYVWSSYSNDNLVIQQLAPSIGFGFNDNADWLELKVYLISSSDKALSQGESTLSSARIKWKHGFDPGALFAVDNFFVDVLAGQRIYAVDNESYTVYNLEGLQQASALLGFGWRPGEDFDISVIAGIEQYKNKNVGKNTDDTYNREFIHISLTKYW